MFSRECLNDDCEHIYTINVEQLSITESEPGNHTTQYEGEVSLDCPSCNTSSDFDIVWEQVNDTGEVLG